MCCGLSFAHRCLIYSSTTPLFIPCLTCYQFSAGSHYGSVYLLIAFTAYTASCGTDAAGSLEGVKGPERDALHCTPSIAWVQDVCRRNSTPICAFGTCEVPAWIFRSVTVGCAVDWYGLMADACKQNNVASGTWIAESPLASHWQLYVRTNVIIRTSQNK
jgi:hypothetical protein